MLNGDCDVCRLLYFRRFHTNTIIRKLHNKISRFWLGVSIRILDLEVASLLVFDARREEVIGRTFNSSHLLFPRCQLSADQVLYLEKALPITPLSPILFPDDPGTMHSPWRGTKEMLTQKSFISFYLLPVSDPGISFSTEHMAMMVNLCSVFFGKENFMGKFAIEETLLE